MENLNGLIINRAYDLPNSKGMSDLIEFMKMQGKRREEFLKLPMEEKN